VSIGVALGLVVLLLEGTVPLVVAARVFRRRDW